MRYTCCILLSLFFALNTLFAQNNNTINYKDKDVVIDGQTFTSHIVKRKETLYSLSKVYNVTIADLIAANPDLVNGLKTGMLIVIPSGNDKQSISKSTTMQSGQKETDKTTNAAERLRRKDTTEAKTDVQQSRRKEKTQLEEAVQNDQVTALSRSSRQSENEAKSQNRNIDSRGLFKGKIDNDILITDDTASDEDRYAYRDSHISTVGIILPINASNVDMINSNYMDFYSGALLAAQDLKEEGASFNINLYDQGNYRTINSLLDAIDRDNNNLLIGPIKSNDISHLIGYINENRIPLISPMDQSANKYIDSSEFIIQIPASKEDQLDNLVSSLAEEYNYGHGTKVLLISEKNGNDAELVKEIEDRMTADNIHFSVVSYGILEGRTILPSIQSHLIADGGKNLIIVPSNEEAFVSDVVRNLSLCYNEGYDISLFGFPKWKNYENVDIDLLHKMNLHLSIPYFVDYGSSNVKDFLMRYRAIFKAEPSPYAFQGYDILKYFVGGMSNRNIRSFMKDMPEMDMLQSSFNIRKKSYDSGYENTATKNIIYNPDYTISITTIR